MIFRCFTLSVFGSLFLSFPGSAQVEKTDVSWYEKLPDCPCRNPDLNGVVTGDGWARDKGNIDKYHKGAAASFRSYPYTKTSAGNSGQQCCYDVKGNLITDGRGAGTPDKVSTCKGEDRKGFMKARTFALWGHYMKDVKPWSKKMKSDKDGWKSYNILWLPNRGVNCESNEI